MTNNLKNNNLNFDLSTFSQNNITFLSDLVENKKLFKIGNYLFFKIPNMELDILKEFLSILDLNKAYVVLPILTTQNNSAPILSLSRQILVTRDSNPITVSNFILNQIAIAILDYGLNEKENFIVVFKFKPISLKDETIKQISKIDYTQNNKSIKKEIKLLNNKYYNGSIIPLSMNLSFYGRKIEKWARLYYILKFNLNPDGILFYKNEYVIYIYKNGLKHEGILFKDKQIFFKFKDELISENKFIRIYNNHIFYIDNFNVNYFDSLIKNSILSNSKNNSKLNSNIVTFDIETYVKNDQFVPFACGWYNGEITKTYYLTNFKSSYKMLLQALLDLLDFNPNAKVYIHNFANFDYMFLIKVLFENFIVSPKFKDNKVINLSYHHKDNNNIKVEMFDSYLILPSSLRTLAEKYIVENQKGYFPYSFVNENNLDYIGVTPDITLFNDMSYEEYGDNFSYNWNLREELIRYLELDLKSLYQIITKFSEDIFNNEKIDITKLPTNSAISLKIFRANYLKNNRLAIIKGISHNEMRNAYYGGVVEVFRNEGYNLKYYDVNSLYPFAMLNDIPTGDMTFSTDPNLINYFGIVYVTVDSSNLNPSYLNYPLLPHKVDGRMYNPLGSWTGWYFSEEVKLAASFGYNISVHHGYKFDKSSNIFNNFINKYFNIKAGLSDINMDRTTAKMILNSLYGRLGMKPSQDIIEIVNFDKAENILSKYNVKEQYTLTDKLEFIRYENKPISGFLELYGKDEYLNFMLDCDSKNISVNQSIPCAIAITAYARMYMFKIIYRLIELGIEIYYMDTDSMIINGCLPSDLIGDKLGQFKLEHEIAHAYFISPKLYALNTMDGKTIVKAKGIGSKLNYGSFEALMRNEGIKQAQERWFKDPSNANINIKDINLHISSLNLKRKQIIESGRLAFTNPLFVENYNIKS
jgi:DNA polymerase type B, organellar and viral